MDGISCSEKNYFEDTAADVATEMTTTMMRRRKIYRVETFIIPGKMNNKIFRSTEELDLDFHQDKLEKDEEEEEEDEEIGTLEFPQLSVNRENDVAEFVPQNSEEENFEPELSGTVEAEESLCNIDGDYFEEESCGRSPADSEKRNCEIEEEDSFLIVGFDCTLNFEGEKPIPANTNIERSQSFDFLPSLKSGSDLKSIKESSCELVSSYGSCEELCHHGNKNGCTVTAQSPSQVSEEIFKENWMQRLEFLRRRVSLIRDKEVALQERERLLMKKEKELRILERLVKEKIQRADLYLKRCTIRNPSNLEDDLPQNLFLYELSRPSPPPYPEKPQINGSENNTDVDSREISTGSRISDRSKGSSTNSTRSGSSRGEKIAIKDSRQSSRGTGSTGPPSQSLKNLGPRKTAASVTSGLNTMNPKTSEIARSLEGPKDFRRSKWSAYSSWRCRSKPKLTYDDMDSTLSADIGDSSFAITSKKLDPRLVQKPRGFSRSASERGPKNRPCSLDLDIDLGPDGERVLRKISENISAIANCQLSQGTRFQDYGSIDKRHRSEPKIDDLGHEKISAKCFENKTNGYRTDQANLVAEKDQLKSKKERPSFWNEEASDWLRKKRQAYNLATKRIPNRDYETNKENLGSSKSAEKKSRSKNEKGKKFTIFR